MTLSSPCTPQTQCLKLLCSNALPCHPVHVSQNWAAHENHARYHSSAHRTQSVEGQLAPSACSTPSPKKPNRMVHHACAHWPTEDSAPPLCVRELTEFSQFHQGLEKIRPSIPLMWWPHPRCVDNINIAHQPNTNTNANLRLQHLPPRSAQKAWLPCRRARRHHRFALPRGQAVVSLVEGEPARGYEFWSVHGAR